MGARGWTAEEDAQVRDLVSRMSTRKAAEIMGKTHAAVKRYCDRHKIPRVPQRDWYKVLSEQEKAARQKNAVEKAPRKYGTQAEGKRLRQRQRLMALTVEILDLLGGKCAECGETRYILLEIDHVNNDGTPHRKSVPSGIPYYRELLRTAQEEPGRLQALCANCHRRKRRLLAGWPADSSPREVAEEVLG